MSCSLTNSPEDAAAPGEGGGDTTSASGGAGTGGAGGDCALGTLADCGACGDKCEPANVNGPSCDDGTCSYDSCVEGFLDCDGDVPNGCEVNSQNDLDNCGACNEACDAANATPMCASGECAAECDDLWGDCDDDVSTGCETPLNTVVDCGTCGAPCEPANVTGALCLDGDCGYDACSGAYLDCDLDTSNGCEIDGATDENNCNACGEQCGSDEECIGGECLGLPTNCLDILQKGQSMGDQIYTIDPNGGDPSDAFDVFCDMTLNNGGWNRCLSFTNTAAEDMNNNTWFDQCIAYTNATWTEKEVMLVLRDEGGNVVYDGFGTRPTDWTAAKGTCPNCSDNEHYKTELHELVKLNTDDELQVSGNVGSGGGCIGDLGDGYALTLYGPDPPPFSGNDKPRIVVMPYRDQISSNNPRALGAGNQQWFENNEISYDGTLAWNVCGFPPAFLGTFEFYVR